MFVLMVFEFRLLRYGVWGAGYWVKAPDLEPRTFYLSSYPQLPEKIRYHVS